MRLFALSRAHDDQWTRSEAKTGMPWWRQMGAQAGGVLAWAQRTACCGFQRGSWGSGTLQTPTTCTSESGFWARSRFKTSSKWSKKWMVVGKRRCAAEMVSSQRERERGKIIVGSSRILPLGLQNFFLQNFRMLLLLIIIILLLSISIFYHHRLLTGDHKSTFNS